MPGSLQGPTRPRGRRVPGCPYVRLPKCLQEVVLHPPAPGTPLLHPRVPPESMSVPEPDVVSLSRVPVESFPCVVGGGGGGGRETEKETERGRDRETKRKADREEGRETERQRKRQKQRERER